MISNGCSCGILPRCRGRSPPITFLSHNCIIFFDGGWTGCSGNAGLVVVGCWICWLVWEIFVVSFWVFLRRLLFFGQCLRRVWGNIFFWEQDDIDLLFFWASLPSSLFWKVHSMQAPQEDPQKFHLVRVPWVIYRIEISWCSHQFSPPSLIFSSTWEANWS